MPSRFKSGTSYVRRNQPFSTTGGMSNGRSGQPRRSPVTSVNAPVRNGCRYESVVAFASTFVGETSAAVPLVNAVLGDATSRSAPSLECRFSSKFNHRQYRFSGKSMSLCANGRSVCSPPVLCWGRSRVNSVCPVPHHELSQNASLQNQRWGGGGGEWGARGERVGNRARRGLSVWGRRPAHWLAPERQVANASDESSPSWRNEPRNAIFSTRAANCINVTRHMPGGGNARKVFVFGVGVHALKRLSVCRAARPGGVTLGQSA